MLAHLTREEYDEALERTAEELLWEADQPAGAVDAFRLANRLGVTVLRDDHLPQRGQLVRLATTAPAGTQATVLLGRERRTERRHWALAHELGEGVAFRVFNRLGIGDHDIQPGTREQVANALASRLLLPLRAFRKAGVACDWDLLDMKVAFPTASHELIARRMLDLKSPLVVTVVDERSITWRRTNQGSVSHELSAAERDLWGRCHYTATACDTTPDAESTGLSRIRAWAIHEPEWKREIVIAEASDD